MPLRMCSFLRLIENRLSAQRSFCCLRVKGWRQGIRWLVLTMAAMKQAISYVLEDPLERWMGTETALCDQSMFSWVKRETLCKSFCLGKSFPVQIWTRMFWECFLYVLWEYACARTLLLFSQSRDLRSNEKAQLYLNLAQTVMLTLAILPLFWKESTSWSVLLKPWLCYFYQ